jgi:tetratricopeptide (TPR) repeat protein
MRSVFPEEGIQLSFFLYELVEKLGGREKFEKMTTRDVWKELVAPLTHTSDCSYLTLLKCENSNLVKKAKIFISHVWSYPYLWMVDTLTNYFEQNSGLNDTYIWIDVFSLNLHEEKLTSEWLIELKSGIKEFDRAILILDQWQTPLKRAWCLFDAFCATDTGIAFEIVMSAEDTRSFMEEMRKGRCKDRLDSFLSVMDVTNSESAGETTFPEDKEVILSMVQESGGWEKVTRTILQAVRSWLLKTVGEAMTNVKMIAGSVYQYQNDFQHARQIYRECLEWRVAHLGDTHPLTLETQKEFTTVSHSLQVAVGDAGSRDKLESLSDEKNLDSFVADSSDIPKDGIQFSFFVGELVTQLGGREKLSAMTTADICRNFIIPRTKVLKCSYATLLKKNYPRYVKKANVFISHTWLYSFLSVVDALKNHADSTSSFENLDDTYIWFDLFSNNQHETDHPFEWWSTTFKSAIKEFRHTVLVSVPWSDPIALKRVWCLFEIYCTADTGSKLEIAMTAEEKQTFMEEMRKGSCKDNLEKFLTLIDVAKSTATKDSDKESIFEVIEKSMGGFTTINEIILQKIRSCLLKTVEEEMIKMKMIEGNLFQHQGNYNRAEKLYDECRTWRITNIGENHPQALESAHELSILLQHSENYRAGLEMAKDCYQRRKVVLGEFHPDTLASLSRLGFLFNANSQLDEAEEQLSRCVEAQLHVLGHDHIDTLKSISQLAAVYQKRNQYAKAEELLMNNLEILIRYFGPFHRETLSCLHETGIIFYNQKKFDGAEKYLKQSLDGKTRILGEHHLDTLITLNSYGVSLSYRQIQDEAERILQDCLAKSKVAVGLDHPHTMSTMFSLGRLYYNQGKFDHAELHFENCFSGRKGRFHQEHPALLDTSYWLGSTYYKLEKYSKACEHWQDCYERRKETLG